MLNLYSKNLNGAKYQNVFFVTKTMTQKNKSLITTSPTYTLGDFTLATLTYVFVEL